LSKFLKGSETGHTSGETRQDRGGLWEHLVDLKRMLKRMDGDWESKVSMFSDELNLYVSDSSWPPYGAAYE